MSCCEAGEPSDLRVKHSPGREVVSLGRPAASLRQQSGCCILREGKRSLWQGEQRLCDSNLLGLDTAIRSRPDWRALRWLRFFLLLTSVLMLEVGCDAVGQVGVDQMADEGLSPHDRVKNASGQGLSRRQRSTDLGEQVQPARSQSSLGVGDSICKERSIWMIISHPSSVLKPILVRLLLAFQISR